MKQGARLQLKLGQKTRLAPQLRQAIALLQLNRGDLHQTIREALDTNPLLERDDGDQSDSVSDDFAEHDADADTSAGEIDDAFGEEYNEDWGFDDLPDGFSPVGDSAPNYDEFISNPADETLQQHLLWQVNLAGFSDTDEAIAQAIVYALDEDGYLHDDLATLRASLAPEWLVSVEEIEAVLERVQHFEPLGVASRSISESLLVQLRAMPVDTAGLQLACHLVEHHLEALADHDLRRLAQSAGARKRDIKRALAVIQRCNPYPCARFVDHERSYVIPDVYVHPAPHGWQVTLNPDNAPALRLNPMYTRLAREARGSDRKYLRDRMQEARWLINGLEMRNQTLLAVSSAIVSRQSDFFEHGEKALRPLLQREVSEQVGVHESTVSRATTEKYIHTPRGIFELKYFFSTGIDSGDGQQVSATAVKARLRDLVSQEPPEKPFSDQALADRLAESGIRLARRTVAKYREQLGIPGSARRRKKARPPA